MNEPTVAALSGSSPGAVVRRYFLATRPKFFTASILPVLAGTAWGATSAGQLDLAAAIVAMLATVAVQAASNVFNDVGDDLNGTDRNNAGRIHPFTGGSRFIQNGILTLEQMQRWAKILFLSAIALGLILIYMKGMGVLYLGLAGMALGMLYSLPAVQLSARGIGEMAVAAGCGILPVCGAAWIQSGAIGVPVLLLSVPISCWVAAILLINEVPDRDADEQAGKRTWPVRFGLGTTRWIYVLLHLVAVAAVAVLVAFGAFPWWTLVLPLLLFAGGWKAGSTIVSDDGAVLETGIKTTLAIHAVGSLWLTVVILAARL
ncbi:MAG: prenyltransferase [Gammaproteobacteria bacterium]|nr:prenyltransferase [Gammaproteobacteria bacterium]NNF59734.1 prenyltransferase [Gammaproteobacteria bacterium]